MSEMFTVSQSRFWKCVEYILYIYFATFPFITYKTFLLGGTSARAANLILVASIIGIGLAAWLMRKQNKIIVPKSPILLIVGIYFLWLIIASLAGIDFGTSFWSTVSRTTGLWYFLHLGLLLTLLIRTYSNPESHRKFVLAVVLSTALYSFLYFLSPEGVNALFFGYETDAFTFGNSSFAGMYIFGAFMLSLYYLFQAETKKWWMYVLPLVIIINPAILNSVIFSGDISAGWVGEARSSAYAVGLSLIGLVMTWVVSKIHKIKTRTITAYSLYVFGIFCAVFAAVSLFSPDGIIREGYLARATQARPLVWELSDRAIAERPIIGWGIENFERVFEVNYDNRLLQDEYGNEAWFDRAHNVFIDQLIDTGILGLILYLTAYLVSIACLIYSGIYNQERKDRILSSVLIVYFTLHLVELQTAFDTTISYPMLIIMVASAVIVFQRTQQQRNAGNAFTMPRVVSYVAGGASLIFFVWSLGLGWLPFVRAQMANGTIRTIGSSVKRIELYPTLFSSSVDQHLFLWRTLTDLKVGITGNPKLLEDPVQKGLLKKELLVIIDSYEKFVDNNPSHFRSHLNLADALIFIRLFEVDRLEQAQLVLDDAIKLVPQSPQPYWMKAVAYIYMRKFDLAREYAKKAYDLNPKITESSKVIDYVEKSIENFPNIDLYHLKQI